MLNIKLIAVGGVKEAFYRNKINEFKNNISKYANFTITEIKDESIPGSPSDAVIHDILETEGKKILESVTPQDFVVTLCIDGKLTTTGDIKAIYQKASDMNVTNIVFVIGGSLGLSTNVVKRANYKLSFSRMTFPHQLMRVMIMEQLYSALS